MGISFVTGASSGIGRSLARRMAFEGETIVAVARRKSLLDSLVREIVDGGGQAIAIACDVTDRAQVLAAVTDAEARLGPIERLVACAGGGERTAVDAFDAGQVDRILALNVGGTANCIEALLPGMLERRSGHLVAVSSLAAYRGLPGAAAYSAAKAALSNMIESLRIDLQPRGIAVTLICPGFVRANPSPGKKRKPFQLELEKATEMMWRAIAARRKHYAFPWPLVIVAGAARLLPAALYDRLLSGVAAK
jgi:short-subunit dehydrogenase